MLGAILKHSVTMTAVLNKVRFTGKITQECLKQDKNIFSPSLIVRTLLTKCKNQSSRNSLVQRQQMSTLDVNTNVFNNVILFKYDRPRYFMIMKMFAFGQLFGWSTLAWYSYTSNFFDIFNTDIKFKEYLRKYTQKLIIFNFSIIAGPIIFILVYVTCTRTVKHIILHKGGKIVTISTYHPIKKKSTMVIGVDKVHCPYTRSTSGVTVPLKIEDRSFHYILEKSGQFFNTYLFDNTVGFANIRKRS